MAVYGELEFMPLHSSGYAIILPMTMFLEHPLRMTAKISVGDIRSNTHDFISDWPNPAFLTRYVIVGRSERYEE
jgi:hypothetical protein